MSILLEEWTNVEVRSVIRYFRAKRKNAAEIHRKLVEVYGPNVMSRKQVWVWCVSFDNGRTDVNDEQRTGRPTTCITDDYIHRIGDLIKNDKHISLRAVANEFNISVSTVHYIVHEQLKYKKVCARWVPKKLTDDLISTRMGFSLTVLISYQEEETRFLKRIVTGEETWVHYLTQVSKQIAATSEHASSSSPKKCTPASLPKKILVTVFWDYHGVLYVHFFSQENILYIGHYRILFRQLKQAIHERRPKLQDREVIFLYDSIKTHINNRMQELLQQHKWKFIQHPPHSPDLSPSDFHLFGPMKKQLAGKRYNTDNQVKETISSWLNNLGGNFFRAGFNALVYRWNECLDKFGEYVEK